MTPSFNTFQRYAASRVKNGTLIFQVLLLCFRKIAKADVSLGVLGACRFNPLSPNRDENEISLNIITTCSNIQVMRIKEVITKDKIS